MKDKSVLLTFVVIILAMCMAIGCTKKSDELDVWQQSETNNTEYEEEEEEEEIPDVEPSGKIIVYGAYPEFYGGSGWNHHAAVDASSKAVSPVEKDVLESISRQYSSDGEYYFKAGLLKKDGTEVNIPFAIFRNPWFLSDNKIVFWADSTVDIGSAIYSVVFNNGQFGEPQVLFDQAVLLSTSPDRKDILVEKQPASVMSSPEIVVSDKVGKNIRTIGTLESLGIMGNGAFFWSPDSNFVAYAAASSQGGVPLKYEDIYIQSVRPEKTNSTVLPSPINITNQNYNYEKVEGWIP